MVRRWRIEISSAGRMGNLFPPDSSVPPVQCVSFKPGHLQLLLPRLQRPNLGRTFLQIDILQMTMQSTPAPPPCRNEDNIRFQLVVHILVMFSFYSLTIFVLLKSCLVINEILQFC